MDVVIGLTKWNNHESEGNIIEFGASCWQSSHLRNIFNVYINSLSIHNFFCDI